MKLNKGIIFFCSLENVLKLMWTDIRMRESTVHDSEIALTLTRAETIWINRCSSLLGKSHYTYLVTSHIMWGIRMKVKQAFLRGLRLNGLHINKVKQLLPLHRPNELFGVFHTILNNTRITIWAWQPCTGNRLWETCYLQCAYPTNVWMNIKLNGSYVSASSQSLCTQVTFVTQHRPFTLYLLKNI